MIVLHSPSAQHIVDRNKFSGRNTMGDNRSESAKKRIAYRQQVRDAALLSGAVTYDLGEPCVNGHMAPRYTSTTDCVVCAAERQRARSVRKGVPWERAVALEKGEKTYLTGRPCKHGHICERNTTDASCVECRNIQREERRPLMAAHMRKKRAAMSDEDVAKIRRKQREYNRERRLRDPEAVRAMERKHSRLKRQRYPQRKLAEIRLRQAALIKRTPAWCDKAAIRQFYEDCPEGMEVDHIIPLRGKSVSGLHVLSNLQYLTPEQNRKKLNKFFREEVEAADYARLKEKGLAR